MEGLLSKIPGVKSASVDYDSKMAKIECETGDIAAAITKALDASGQYSGTLQN